LTLAGFNAAAASIEVLQGNGTAILGTSKNDTISFAGMTSVTGLPYVDGLKGNDAIFGSELGDELRGNAGNDALSGGGGSDRLLGGAGNDTLSGGADADTFVFAESGSKNRDYILDYDFDQGDRIDLSALLDAGFGLTSLIADFVRLTLSGSNLLLQVDPNGLSGGAKFADVAVLSGYASNEADQVLVYFEQQAQTLSA
jgi:Ca2+-binding RTX toxin-like protein